MENGLQCHRIVHLGIRRGRVINVSDLKPERPEFDSQSWYDGHGGVPLGKAHFLA